MTHLLRRAGLLLLVTMILGVAVAAAQTPSADEQAVVAVVQRIFDAMGTCDAQTIRALTLPEGRLYRLTAGGDQAPRSQSLDEFAGQFSTCTRKLVERSWSPQVRVHKGIATFWAPYDFWIDGKFSHCGIDSFELVNTGGTWKLTSGIYTVEREGCTPSPLGPLQAVSPKP